MSDPVNSSLANLLSEFRRVLRPSTHRKLELELFILRSRGTLVSGTIRRRTT